MATLFSFEFLTGFLLFFIVYWLLVPWVKIQNVMLLIAGIFLSGASAFIHCACSYPGVFVFVS